MNMNLKSKTKLTQNKNSFITTSPKAIRQLLNYEKGDSIEWELNIDDSGKKTFYINVK